MVCFVYRNNFILIICLFINFCKQPHLSLINNGVYIFIKLWENEFDNIVSKRDKLQGLNIIQLKLEVRDTYKKDQKLKTDFEPQKTKMLSKKLIKTNNYQKYNFRLQK